ncbi:MAG: T9SS type A sorting domain-containing protein [Bacteroidales bacterium]
MFEPSGKIVGTLTGGLASCYSQESPDYYGKFSYHWESNGSNDTLRLQPWLDPDNSGVLSLDGTTLGVDEKEPALLTDVVVYPNPASDFVYLKIGKFEAAEINMTLFDLLGKPINDYRFNGSDDVVMIDVSTFPEGLYFIKLTIGNQNIVKRIVKK